MQLYLPGDVSKMERAKASQRAIKKALDAIMAGKATGKRAVRMSEAGRPLLPQEARPVAVEQLLHVPPFDPQMVSQAGRQRPARHTTHRLTHDHPGAGGTRDGRTDGVSSLIDWWVVILAAAAAGGGAGG